MTMAADELVVSSTYVPDSPITIESWDSADQEIPAFVFANSILPESVIRFHFEGTKADSQIQIVYKTAENWTWTVMADALDITGTTLDFALADSESTNEDDMLDGIKAHGIYVKGNAFSIVKVEVMNPASIAPEDPMKDYELASTYTFDSPIAISWTEELISPAPFEKLTSSSFVKFIFTDCGQNPQIQLAYKSGQGSKWTQFSEYENIQGNQFMLDMSKWADPADASNWIPTRGMYLKGQNCSLSGIEIYNKKGAGPSGPGEDGLVVCQTYTLDTPMAGDWSTELNVPSAAFKHLFDVSVIRFVFSEAGEDAQVQVNYKSGAGWTWTTVDEGDILRKQFELKVEDVDDPEDFVTWVKERGVILKGQNFTLTQIITLNPEGIDDDPEVEMEVVETYDCNSTIVGWDDEAILIPTEVFAKLGEKSQVVLSFTDCDGGQAQIAYSADDAEGTWTQFAEYTNIEANKIVFNMKEWKNPAGALAGIKKNGLFLKGQKFTLVKVEVLNPKGGSGVETIGKEVSTVIDWNAPVEIYNISGARVSEMSKGQVYIVRQGSNVVKVVK